jgi:tetratricopeptide (TPR) repeat protein
MRRNATPAPDLTAAMRHHQAGDLVVAEQLYRAVLRQQPRNSDAHNLLGLMRFQQQDYAAASTAIRRAVSLRPDAGYCRNLGMALRAEGRLEQALAAYRRAASLQPDAPETHFNMGNLLAQMEQPENAAEAFRRALSLRPEHPAGWQNLGGALLAAGQPEAAVEALRAALRQQPGQATALYNLGLALERLRQWPEAIEAFRSALEQGGFQLEPALHLAQCLREAQEWPGAEAAFGVVIREAPDSAEGWQGLGLTLQTQARLEEASAALAEATRLRPDWPDAHYNLAGVLEHQGQLEQAEAALRRSLALQPDHHQALTNLGNLLTRTGRPEEGLACCRQAHSLAPEERIPRLAYARHLLMFGRFGEGWDLLGARWRPEDPLYDAGLPLWDGQPLAEGRILVWREQGIGDEVMFASLLPELLALGHRISLLCEPRLRIAFQRAFPGIEIHHPGDSHAALRAQIPLGDLPRLLRRQEADFAHAPPAYLQADPHRRAALRARYEDGRPLVGIAWRTLNDATTAPRSMTLADLAPILGDSRLRFVSLQYGDIRKIAEEAKDYPVMVDRDIDALASVEDALAQIAAMDMVLSIDSSTAHFAGALGTPCQVMLPADAGWRWMLMRDDTPWYPSMRLLRQQRGESWHQLAGQVAARLADDAKKYRCGTRRACEK